MFLMHNKLTAMTYDIFCQLNDSKNCIRTENLPYLYGNLYIPPHMHYILLLSKNYATIIITVPAARKTLPWESTFITICLLGIGAIISPHVAALSQFISTTTNKYNMTEYFKSPPNKKKRETERTLNNQES